jgi:anti-repressor protein
MTNLQAFANSFNFGLHEVRVVLQEGEPWFVLGDICRALNLSNPSMVAQRLQPHQRSKASLGRQGDAIVINESGLYRVVLRSDSPHAEPFQVWVTEDVLPSVRKTGSYTAAPEEADPLVMAQRYVESETARRVLAAQNATLAPKAEQFDTLMSAEGTYAIADAAKILGTGEVRLFKLLRDRSILMDGARSGVEHHNVPYQQYLDAGYFDVITRPRGDGARLTYTTRLTPKGLAWLDRKMRAERLLPPVLPPPTGAQA